MNTNLTRKFTQALNSLAEKYKTSRYRSNLRKSLIVTGADSSHFKSLIQFLNNIDNFFEPHSKPEVMVWNLGLKPEELEVLVNHSAVSKITLFQYSDYPNWFDIKKNAGEYAWKPNLIYDSMLATNKKYLLWMDSGDLFVDHNQLSSVYEILEKNQIYSPVVDGSIAKWTHPGMFAYLNIVNWTIDPTKMRNRNGAIMFFNIKKRLAKEFIREFAMLSRIKECIAPEGSSRLNHRQDQSLFSLLYYQFIEINSLSDLLPNSELQLGISIHNDVDIKEELDT